MSTQKLIGGFFPLALDVPCGPGVLEHWGVRPGNHVAFHNARSALHYLLERLRARQTARPRMWLPSYVCADVAQAAGNRWALDFYPVDAELTADSDFLHEVLRKGDVVVGVDYFGRPPRESLKALALERRDVTWVEDRAQAFSAGPAWGDYVLYSPRKLMGVADGGVLVGSSLGEPEYRWEAESSFLDAALLRYEDRDEAENAVWYSRYVQAESRMGISARPMSTIAHTILTRIDAREIAARRQENYRTLWERVRDWALWPEAKPWEEQWTPLGFAIRLPEAQRDSVAQALHGEKIFAAVHWKDLACPRDRFAEAWTSSHQVLTLPCDQRYDADDMERVADAFERAVR